MAPVEILAGVALVIVVLLGGLVLVLRTWVRLTGELARSVTEIARAVMAPQGEVAQPPDSAQEDITGSPPWAGWGDPEEPDYNTSSLYVGPLSPEEMGNG